MHYDDGPAPWRQRVERTPHGDPGQQGCFLCVPWFDGRTPFRIVSLADGRFSPLVAPEIDQGSDEPGFFARCTDRNGRLGLGGSDKRVLHEIERIIGTGRESPGQTIQARVVRVEQGSQSASSVVRRGEWDVGSHRHAVHTLPRRAAPGICWGPPRDTLRSRVSAAGRRTTEEGAGRGDIDRLRSAVDDTDGHGERNRRTLKRSAIEGSPSVAGFPTSESQKSRGAGLSQPYGTTAKSEIRVYIHVRGHVDAMGALCGLPLRISNGLFQALSNTRCCLARRCFLRYVSTSNFVSLRSALRFCCDRSARSFIANAVSAKSGISAL